MSGLVEEPVPRAWEVLLRRLVLDHKATERRRVFPPVLHVGRPGRPAIAELGDPDAPGTRGHPGLDDALRCDLLEAVLRRSDDDPDVLAWLTRSGPLALQDADAAWVSAVSAVAGETGRALRFVVVTRRGWRDPRSGIGREWRRLRLR